jgi:hypothetical protein
MPDREMGRELGHPQLATGDGQLSEHVKVGQGQTGLRK